MKNSKSQSVEEIQIRNLIDKKVKAIQEKNIDEALASYASDVVSFDVVEPLLYEGIDEVRARLTNWFSTFNGSIDYEVKDLKIEANDKTAFCYCLNHVSALRNDGEKLDMWWRETTCYQKIKDQWTITHAHSSVPFDPATGNASLNLKP